MKKIALTLSFVGISLMSMAQTAEEIINKYVAAIGGKEAIEKVKDVSMSYAGEVQGQSLEILMQKKAPNKSKTVVTIAGMGEVQNVTCDGTKARMSGMQGTQDITSGEQLDGILRQGNPFPELAYLASGAKITAAGTEKINGKDSYKIEGSLGEAKWTEYYDVATGLKNRMIVSSAMGSMTLDYEDYKEVNGIKFPHKLNQDMGMFQLALTASKIDVNKGIEDSVFEIK